MSLISPSDLKILRRALRLTCEQAAASINVTPMAWRSYEASPKVLMQSGIGPEDHLREVGVEIEHALEGAGSNLQDHLDLFAIARINAKGLEGTNIPGLHLTQKKWSGIGVVVPTIQAARRLQYDILSLIDRGIVTDTHFDHIFGV